MAHVYQDIEFSYRDGIGHIVLNRPAKLNSFTQGMHEDLRHALSFLESREDLRGVILTGAGRAFCAGQDLSERKPLPPGQSHDLGEGIEKNYKPLVLRLRALPVPVVCVVNGVAAGAGASVALACDVVFAVKSAKFIQAFAKIGLLPDAGATYFWPKLVGMQRSMGAALFAEPVSAEQAEEWGLIWRCIPDEELESTIASVHNWLAGAATQALSATKAALHASLSNTLAQQITLEGDHQRELGRSEDYREGVEAFAQKRPPVFKGR